MDNNTIYKIGITLIPGIGDVLAKNLISYCGSVEAVFKEKKAKLMKVPGIGETLADIISKQKVLSRAEEEIKFIERYKITPLFFLDKNYPKRLSHCADSPVMLYYKGNADLNHPRIISVIGTRDATNYGKDTCEKFIAELSELDVLVVSGLAYGIDICAHKAAVKNNISTIGVMAHGLDRLYPSAHRSTAEKMVKHGGLLTDFMSQTNPDAENFPKRNRIVAGMCDAVVVIESKKGGGSLITTDIANSYNRDVFAFPGRINDENSEGCNNLIKSHKAALIQSANDLVYVMGWQKDEKKKSASKQQKLLIDLNPEEEVIVNLLQNKEGVAIDELCFNSKMSVSKISSVLLTLELQGVVKSLPGKAYKLN